MSRSRRNRPHPIASRALKALGLGLLVAAVVTLAVLAIPSPILAQSSPSHTLSEQVFNGGGRPAQAVISTSASFRISLDSIGEPIAAHTLAGASFRMDGGLAASFPPAGEIDGLLLLADRQTLVWSPEPASTTYNVYTGLLSSLPGGFGACAVARVPGTSAVDATTPAPGTGLFYLVTGVNRLREEGTKGRASDGTARANPAPCP
ncbi:MAG TPA: hypothetical protein VJV75_09245 [Candidatus Polarisedimenticolia bacterium]|nr:hypothetical protein [Candidatus Polarisedimenticolia bacterium]